MSDDLVNQLTLNFLISKHQLLKLTKRLKETTEQTRKTDKEIYRERIQHLFKDLLVNDVPEDVLQDVKTGFEFFVDKCIYYFKALDNHDTFEKESLDDCSMIQDDIDYEKEERAIERGNYQEDEEQEDEEQEDELEDEEQEDEELEDEELEDEEQEDEKQEDEELEDEEQEEEVKEVKEVKSQYHHPPVVVKHKYTKQTTSVGVDDIQKLPLDWFQSVRENYKKNQILPRRRNITYEEKTFRDPKKKI